MSSKIVCVTGASGFIASTIVQQLLEKGYTVRGTVRSTKDASKVAHLTRLPGAAERLQLFEADLLAEGSFDEAVRGSEVVIHTASPCTFVFEDGWKHFVEPALQGTRTLINSVNKAGGVKRVVLTSSVVAIAFNGGRLPPDHVYTEADWSPEDFLESNKLFYHLSKTLAEKEAWELQKSGTGWDLVTVNPSYVFGQLLQPGLNASSSFLVPYLDGSKTEIPNEPLVFVDLHDVAEVHVRLVDAPSASGRYLLIGGSPSWETVCQEIRKLRPDLPVPTKRAEGAPAAPMLFDNSKAAALLGRPLRTLGELLPPTIDSLIAGGFVKNEAS